MYSNTPQSSSARQHDGHIQAPPREQSQNTADHCQILYLKEKHIRDWFYTCEAEWRQR